MEAGRRRLPNPTPTNLRLPRSQRPRHSHRQPPSATPHRISTPCRCHATRPSIAEHTFCTTQLPEAACQSPDVQRSAGNRQDSWTPPGVSAAMACRPDCRPYDISQPGQQCAAPSRPAETHGASGGLSHRDTRLVPSAHGDDLAAEPRRRARPRPASCRLTV